MKKGVLLITSFLILANLTSDSASNEIHLKSRRFSPPKGITNAAKAKIEATSGKAHVLIQLECPPTIKQRKGLEDRGIRLLSYVPDNTWFASIPSDKTSEILALANVRAVAEILPDDKIHPEIKKGNFLKHRVKDGKVDLIVKFFKDVSLEEAELVIQKHKGYVVGRVPALNALVVTLKKEKSIDLGYEEAVMWIEQELPLEELNDGARIATSVEIVQGTPPNYDLDGSGVTVLVYDSALVDDTHIDFGSRVTLGESGSIGEHATHVAGTVGGDGYMSDKQAQAGYDCTTCPELFPPGKTPKYVTVTFFGIKDCKPYLPDDPPNNSYVLKQENACIWHYIAINGIMQLDIWWRPWYYDKMHLYAVSRTGGPWFKYESSVGCEKGYFLNDINLCGDNHGKGGMGYVSWQPVLWPSGDSYQWRGMGPAVDIVSYYVNGACNANDPNNLCLYNDSGQIADMNDDFNEGIATHDANLGTASVGAQPAQWTFLTGTNYCDYEGDYSAYAELIDTVVYKNFIPITWAAGNDRLPLYGRPCGEYSTISPTATVKNAITVGATNSDNNLSWYGSSWGPTDDGRIKPDLVAPGCQYVPNGSDDGIVSTIPGDTYTAKCGTSMATPVVAGSISLMLQYWRQTHTQEPNILPSTIKAILIQTAKDLGNDGPDYSFGYGLIDVNEAVKLIGADDANSNVIMEDSIDDQNDKDLFVVDVPAGQNKLKITLVWDDYPAAPNPSRALVNNLDLIVIEPNGTKHYPWTLDPNNPSTPAEANKADHLNNVEQVEVNNPVSGLWMVEVNGPNVPVAPQSYSLVSNFALEDCFPSCHPDYNEWVSVGKPSFWCNPRQCHAELNNATEVVAKITYWVGYADLTIFLSQWLSNNPQSDINHKTEVVNKITYRVGPADLTIFLANWLSNPPADCLDCPGLMESQQAEQAIAEPVDIGALIEQLEEIWDTDQQIREQISEDDWLKFIDSLKEQSQN